MKLFFLITKKAQTIRGNKTTCIGILHFEWNKALNKLHQTPGSHDQSQTSFFNQGFRKKFRKKKD